MEQNISRFDKREQIKEKNKNVTTDKAANLSTKTVDNKVQEHNYIDNYTNVSMDVLNIEYEKTFGELIFLGLSSERIYPASHEKAGQIAYRRYQVFSNTHLKEFVVRIDIEDKFEVLDLKVGVPVTLINPKGEPFAILQSDNRTVNAGFSFKADDIVLKAAMDNKADVKTDVKVDTKQNQK